MQRFVSSIGFSPNLVTRPIIAKGISAGDRIDLIRPEQPDAGSDERASNAVDDVRSTLGGVVSSVDVNVVEITDLDYESAVDECSRVLMSGPPPVVCLGAGATDIHLPLVTATLAHEDHVVDTMMHSDLKNTSVQIDMPSLTADLPGRARETFERLATAGPDSKLSLSAIAEENDVARTTVGRHVQSLENHGFVTTEIVNKEKVVSLTTLGRVIARNVTTEL